MTSNSDHLTIFVLKILENFCFVLESSLFVKNLLLFQKIPITSAPNLTIYKNIYSINSLTSPLNSRILKIQTSTLQLSPPESKKI